MSWYPTEIPGRFPLEGLSERRNPMATYHPEQRRGGFRGWGRTRWLVISIVLIAIVVVVVLLLTYSGGGGSGGGGGY
jgi:hypothetical protein